MRLPREPEMNTRVFVSSVAEPNVTVVVEEKVDGEWIERERFVTDRNGGIRTNRKVEPFAVYPNGYWQANGKNGGTEYTRKDIDTVLKAVKTAIFEETQTFGEPKY